MDQSTSRYGGTGRYHSRVVWPPPRPPAPAGGPPGPGGGATRRCIVFAPPLPKISYMRIMPLWFDAMNPRYPGDHMSTNAWVHTPGMPYLIICSISKFENQGSSP